MSTATEIENEAVFRRLHETANSADVERIAEVIDEIIAPDAVIHAPASAEATGPQLMKQIWTTLLRAYPDLHITVEDLIVKDDTIVARQSITATHRGEYLGVAATGRTVTYDEIFILRLARGRIVEVCGVVDMLAQMRQLGAIAVATG